jgi:hypothetical protein
MFPWPAFLYLSLCVYLTWQWVRWVKSERKVTPSWRAVVSLVGLCFLTFSSALSLFMWVHAVITGGYPFYHPVELFCIRYGGLTALLALIAAGIGKGKVRPHIAVMAACNLFTWFADAVAQ